MTDTPRTETVFESRNAVYREILQTGVVVDESGQKYPVDSMASVDNANMLYHAILKYAPKLALEVGMAYGASSLAICTAFAELGNSGQLISVDPNQSTQWHNIGMFNLVKAKLAGHHQLIEELDFTALPRLVKQGQRLDFAYIDGWHTFDYTLLDFFYVDKMLNVGGIVAFNDTHMPAVRRVLGFVTSHRKYQEVSIETPKPQRNVVKQAALSIKNLVVTPDRYFQKLADWEPDWNFYAHF